MRIAALGKFAVVISIALGTAPTLVAQDEAETPPQARAVPRQLIRPNSLTGWESVTRKSLGWTVDGRQLMGGRDSKPLVSDWKFGDCELNFTWRAKAGGALHMRLVGGGDADTLDVLLREGDDCGRVVRGDKPLAPGKTLKASPEARHRATIKRWRDKLQVIVDEQPLAEAAIDGKQRFTPALQVSQGVVSIADLTVTEPLGERLFNGDDLTGWWSQKRQDGWKVEDGELVGQAKGGSYLRSEREFGDFTLSFDYKMNAGGNSGVGIRTPREGWPSGQGMELQILDRPGKDPGSQMSIYKHFPPLERPDRSGQWNRVVIKAEGRIITAWVNGQIAQHADTATHEGTANKPLAGWIGFQDHGAKMRIRNVYVLEAPNRSDTEP